VVLSLPILPAGYASLHIFRTRSQGQIGFPYRTVECPRGPTTSAGRSCITARLVPPPHPGERSYVRAGRSNSCALFVYPLMTNEPRGSIACAVMSCGQAESTVSRFKKWNHLQAPLLPSGCSLGGYGCDQANGGSPPMPICENCGNDYDKAFQVRLNGKDHTFDSFECAIQALAPVCSTCGTRVVGHGVEKDDIIYCCAHCAKEEGATRVRDRE